MSIAPSRLSALADKQDIQELVYGYCRGMDRLHLPTLLSVYHPDAIEDRGESLFVGPAAEMARLAVEQLRTRYEVSQHFVGNVLIELDGDAAHGESYFQAYHRYRPRDGETPVEVIMAGRYLDRFERRAGVWKIAHRKMINDWTRTQPAANIWLERRPGAHRAVRDIADARLSEARPGSG